MEVVINYGFMVMFSSAFPLLPMLVYVFNFLEIKIDSWKLSNVTRRSFPVTCGSIGIWLDIINFMCVLGAVSNPAIIAFTSGFFNSTNWASPLWLFLLAEHVMLLLKIVFDAVVGNESDCKEHVVVGDGLRWCEVVEKEKYSDVKRKQKEAASKSTSFIPISVANAARF
jgi:hypothetical protein